MSCSTLRRVFDQEKERGLTFSRALEIYQSNPAPDLHYVHAGPVDVLAVQPHAAQRAKARYQFVQSIGAAQKGNLAAPGRASSNFKIVWQECGRG